MLTFKSNPSHMHHSTQHHAHSYVPSYTLAPSNAYLNQVATLWGCSVGLSEMMTGLTVVAIGTSLPDTFASRIAAQHDDNADNAIGNITGSNAVNIFLGLGLPWVIASIYYKAKVGGWLGYLHAVGSTRHGQVPVACI